MAAGSGSTGSTLPIDWYKYLHGSSADPDFITSEEVLLPQSVPEPPFPSVSLDLEYLYEFLLGAPSDTRSAQGTTPNLPPSLQDAPDSSNSPPQVTAPVDDGTRLCVVRSASTLPLVPSPQAATFPPPNWRMIPQNPYGRGRRQRNFAPLESVSFNVNGFPGVNMGDAFRKMFTGLDGRDDPILQDAGKVISCRLLLPGYPPNRSVQISTTKWTRRRDPISRSALAHQVSKKLKDHLDLMARSYSIDGSTPKQWEIGKGFMHLDNMFLVRLESVTKGSFQPMIYVLDPTV